MNEYCNINKKYIEWKSSLHNSSIENIIEEVKEKGLIMDGNTIEIDFDERRLSTSIPWILGDMTGVDDNIVLDVLWKHLTIASNIKQVDDIEDGMLTEVNGLSTSTVLNIYSILNIYEKYWLNIDDIIVPLFTSVNAQNEDLTIMDKDNLSLDYFMKIMRDKNLSIQMLSSIYSKNSKIKKSDIDDFLNNFTIYAQIMDDIKDLEEDLVYENSSHLIYQLREKNSDICIDNILNLLLKSWILKHSLGLAIKYLEKSINIVSSLQSNLDDSKKESSKNLVDFLSNELLNLKDIIESLNEKSVDELWNELKISKIKKYIDRGATS